MDPRNAALRANRHTYDAMAAKKDPLCRPASDAELADPLSTVDPIGWLGGSIHGWRVLCLAAGGGRHSSLYSAAGAQVTVVDYSPAMLELDRQMAARHGHRVRIIETSMDDLAGLGDESFDLVVHPVSTCYLPDVSGVFREVARVTKPGGLYISQHKTPVSLQTSLRRGGGGSYEILHSYYRREPVPAPEHWSAAARRLREHGATEYLHRWEELIGGICRSGFVVEDLTEPMHADSTSAADSFADRCRFAAPYVRIKARRRTTTTGPNHRAADAASSPSTAPKIWTP
ncbi:class I SAM-dependent methyltransferase [Crateriforma conspicua]|uniref:Malonyl-[acyl-carrier protein] O-methyltransferase n=1 Tax=Crateriforma conspicua TaxID=2527996 RepID=A0A5C5YFX9_9PLAN|nr:class I SAM-dependent methyltransferase [Crateriforma conspicua]TWT72142.1 Malonyl-[acyl-carrier protein] O-methyltransferase [Crateriforma conspicua]